MKFKKAILWLSKFALINELLAFIYWAAAIYCLLLIPSLVISPVLMPFVFAFYILTVVIFYLFALKKLSSLFKQSNADASQ